jgi:hypothetical protein
VLFLSCDVTIMTMSCQTFPREQSCYHSTHCKGQQLTGLLAMVQPWQQTLWMVSSDSSSMMASSSQHRAAAGS